MLLVLLCVLVLVVLVGSTTTTTTTTMSKFLNTFKQDTNNEKKQTLGNKQLGHKTEIRKGNTENDK